MDHTSLNVSDYPSTMALLRHRLGDPLPGTDAQLRMAPAYRQNATLSRIDDKDCREAGVLALFFPFNDAPHLLLTVRRDNLKQHSGQISLPGGRREPGESLLETALREAHEEVGVVPDEVDVLGQLTPLYIPPSNFCVHPFVGTLPFTPTLYPQDAEVSAILRVPLAHLLSPATLRREPWMLHGNEIEVPFLDVEGHKVWGATAMMLGELLAIIDYRFSISD
jgi:8-oxo-dGTP pyrophosphatase MutT (NUDIX family)